MIEATSEESGSKLGVAGLNPEDGERVPSPPADVRLTDLPATALASNVDAKREKRPPATEPNAVGAADDDGGTPANEKYSSWDPA